MRGPALLLAGIVLFGLLDANGKLLSGEYPLGQVIAVRYASGPEVNTLFVSTSVHDIRLLLPAEERFRHFSDEARVVVSEPLIDLPGSWRMICPRPRGSARMVVGRAGNHSRAWL